MGDPKASVSDYIAVGVKQPHRTRQQASYGCLLPYFSVDTELLRTLLPRRSEPRELEDRASVGSKAEGDYFPPALKRACDTGYETDTSTDRDDVPHYLDLVVTPQLASAAGSVNAVTKPTFLGECDAQLQQLFTFVELHTFKVEADLRALRASMAQQRENKAQSVDNSSTESTNIDSLLLPDSDSECESTDSERQPLLVSTDPESPPHLESTDSGGEEHVRGAVDLLTRLREVVLSLLESISASFTSIDELIRIHDDNTLTPGSGKRFLLSKEDWRILAEKRLDACLTSVDKDLAQFQKYRVETSINGQGQVYEENKTVVEVRRTPVGCASWLTFLLLLAITAVLVFMYFWDSPTWTIYLRLLRSPLLVVFYLILIGINIKGWAAAHIDYVGVFGPPCTGIPTARYLFKVAGFFTVLFGAIVVVLVVVRPFHMEVPIKVLSLIMWLSLLAFLVNPTNTFLRRGRMSVILMFVRVIIAPFHFVYFSDNWFADQLNSTVAVMLDLQYFICYLSTGPWSGDVNTKICTTSGNGIRPIISCLPAVWRMLQCLRVFRDTHQVRQLVNAGKYATTFPVIIFATIFSVRVRTNFNVNDLDFDDVGWIVIMWLLSSFVHALYTFLWDVHYDWGLVHLEPTKNSLRSRLFYRPRLVYYLAIMFDFCLRFTWAVKLSLAIVWHLDSDWLYTMLVIGEILRRFVWNFFRVEYEHVCVHRE